MVLLQLPLIIAFYHESSGVYIVRLVMNLSMITATNSMSYFAHQVFHMTSKSGQPTEGAKDHGR